MNRCQAGKPGPRLSRTGASDKEPVPPAGRELLARKTSPEVTGFRLLHIGRRSLLAPSTRTQMVGCENAPACQRNELASGADKGSSAPARSDHTAQRNRRRSRLRAGPQETRAIPRLRGFLSSVALRSDSRISPVKEQVRNEISADQKKRGEKNPTDNDIQISPQDGFQQKGAKAGPAHDHLNEQRTAHQSSDTESEKGNERVCGGGKCIPIQKRASRDAMPLRGQEKWGIELFRHRRSDVPDERGQNGEHQCRNRQNHVEQQIAKFAEKREAFKFN